jgi:phosphoserine phosphatase
MMLDDVFKMIDQLTPDERQQVKEYIEYPPQTLQEKIDAILATAEPTELQAGTMDIDKLMEAARAMWEGLTEEEIEAIVQSMNEEYIQPDRTFDDQ